MADILTAVARAAGLLVGAVLVLEAARRTCRRFGFVPPPWSW